MKQHFFGFAMFFSIVTVTVFAHAMLNPPSIPKIPAVDPGIKYTKPTSCFKDRHSSMTYNVSGIELDRRTGLITARVELDRPARSDERFMNFHLTTPGSEAGYMVSRAVEIHRGQTSVDVTVSLGRHWKERLSNENFYTFVEFSSDGNFSSMPEDRAAMQELTPVLTIH